MSTPLPPLATLKAGLGRTTETLAAELGRCRREAGMPDWGPQEWRLAMAVAAAHGVSGLLDGPLAWPHEAWRRFLAAQREHVAQRHQRIAALLARIDAEARAEGLPLVALKGSALHALDLYAPGERPMADIDLLVHPDHVGRAAGLILRLGYEESFTAWKHRVFKPAGGLAREGLGEHRDTPINIELHTRIHERLPLATVDITDGIYPTAPRPGLNPYPSPGALMAHLLLHAAGNQCGRSLRLVHLHDLSLLAAHMQPGEWDTLWRIAGGRPWWALPPLQVAARYYRHAVPHAVMRKLAAACPLLLRAASHRQTLTRVSCSHLWLQALPGIEWARSPGEAFQCVWRRLRPSEESARERADMARTQLWLQGQHWVTAPQGRRLLARLLHPVPRMDTLYVLRQALATPQV